jgi:hypothetical protein
MADTQHITVVIVENAGRESEPYLGRPPSDDGCYVFGQHASEPAFLLDLRVRERLENLHRQGQTMNHAVLFWDQASCDRDVLRRANLVARKLSTGGHITFATKDLPGRDVELRLRELAARMRQALASRSVSLSLWIPERSVSREPPPPLAAAWHRVQQFRTRQAAASAAPRPNEAQNCFEVQATLVA